LNIFTIALTVLRLLAAFGLIILIFSYHNVNYFIPEVFQKKKLGPYLAFVMLEGLAVILVD